MAIAARCRVTWIGDGTPPVLDGLGVTRVPVRDAVDTIRRALDQAGRGARAAFLPVATDVVPVEAA